MRVGIEVGGTFTDLVSVDQGTVRVIKVPSTPHSPDVGAFGALGAAGIDPAAVTEASPVHSRSLTALYFPNALSGRAARHRKVP